MIWKPHICTVSAVIPNATITIASRWSTDSLVKDSCNAWDTALFCSYISAARTDKYNIVDSQAHLTVTSVLS